MARYRNPQGRVIAGAQATARPRTPGEAQHDYRSGKRSESRSPVLKWTAPRNGLPAFRPYVYRGSEPLDGRMA